MAEASACNSPAEMVAAAPLRAWACRRTPWPSAARMRRRRPSNLAGKFGQERTQHRAGQFAVAHQPFAERLRVEDGGLRGASGGFLEMPDGVDVVGAGTQRARAPA